MFSASCCLTALVSFDCIQIFWFAEIPRKLILPKKRTTRVYTRGHTYILWISMWYAQCTCRVLPEKKINRMSAVLQPDMQDVRCRISLFDMYLQAGCNCCSWLKSKRKEKNEKNNSLSSENCPVFSLPALKWEEKFKIVGRWLSYVMYSCAHEIGIL